jgi:hypothetical protein
MAPYAPFTADDPELAGQAAPDVGLPSPGGTAPAGGKAESDRLMRERIKALLAAAGAGVMLLPLAKGAKGIAQLAGGGGALMYGSMADGTPAAEGADPKKKGGGKKHAETLTSEVAKGSDTGPPEIQDEYTEQERAIKQQLKPWQELLARGQPTEKTSKQVSDLNAELSKIAEHRAKKTRDSTAAEKARESEESFKSYRNWGLGAGVGLGATAALWSRGKLSGAVKRFEQTATDIPKYTSLPGNTLVSKGGQADELHAAVNKAYDTGGARQPFPSLAHVYGAKKESDLVTAKKYFRDAGDTVPSNAPFSKDNAANVSKLNKVVEHGIPGGMAAESAVTGGMGYMSDDPDRKNMLYNAAAFGGMGAAGFLGARKAGSLLTQSMKPNELSMRAINAGRERLAKDVQGVNMKGVKAFNERGVEIGTSNLDKPKRQFVKGDLNALAEARYAASAKGKAQSDWLSRVHENPDVLQLHAQSIKDGVVDSATLRKALRYHYSGGIEHNGQKIKVSEAMVKKILAALEKAMRGG